MKVRFNVDNGANIHSNRDSDWLDPVEDLGLEPGEWDGLTDDEKWEHANDWAQERIEIYYEEAE